MAAEEMEEKDRKRAKESLCYLSPEQTGRVQFPGDNRTDLYCLGVMFWTLLTGKMPFNGELQQKRITFFLLVWPPDRSRLGHPADT